MKSAHRDRIIKNDDWNNFSRWEKNQVFMWKKGYYISPRMRLWERALDTKLQPHKGGDAKQSRVTPYRDLRAQKWKRRPWNRGRRPFFAFAIARNQNHQMWLLWTLAGKKEQDQIFTVRTFLGGKERKNNRAHVVLSLALKMGLLILFAWAQTCPKIPAHLHGHPYMPHTLYSHYLMAEFPALFKGERKIRTHLISVTYSYMQQIAHPRMHINLKTHIHMHTYRIILFPKCRKCFDTY